MWRVVVVCTLWWLVLASLQWHCVSAVLPAQQNNDKDKNDENIVDLSDDLAELAIRADQNITAPARTAGDMDKERRLETLISAMENRIQNLEVQLLDLRKFISKHQRHSRWYQHIDDPFALYNINRTLQRRVIPQSMPQSPRLIPMRRRGPEVRAREKCANGLCPVGAMKYGCDCLLYVDQDMTWREARAHCATMTGKLVTVHSHGLQRHIERFLEAQLGNRTVEIFTGLIHTTSTSGEPAYTGDLGGSGRADGWYWRGLHQNVTALQNKDFRNWAIGQPPNVTAPLTPSCMQLNGTAIGGLQWHTTHCNTAKGFICHFRAELRRGRKGRRRGNKRRGGGKEQREEKEAEEEEEEESRGAQGRGKPKRKEKGETGK